MTKKVPIQQTTDPFGRAVKEKLDRLTGQHPNFKPLNLLGEEATDVQVVNAYNAMAARINEDESPTGITATKFAPASSGTATVIGGIDGGLAASIYGGTTGIDGGSA
jgi:hypothetical protein